MCNVYLQQISGMPHSNGSLVIIKLKARYVLCGCHVVDLHSFKVLMFSEDLSLRQVSVPYIRWF